MNKTSFLRHKTYYPFYLNIVAKSIEYLKWIRNMIYETCLMRVKAKYLIVEILSSANVFIRINLILISLYNQVNHFYKLKDRAFKIEFTVMKNNLEKCAKKFNYRAE